jgi:CBS domain-containing protein
MLRDIISPNLVTIRPDADVREVAELMDSRNVGSVLVLEGGKPVGIVTDRDIVVRCLSQSKTPVENFKVSDVMTESLHTVRDTEGFYDVIKKMRDEKIRRMPVVNDQGKPVGIITFGDVIGILAKALAGIASTTTAVGEEERGKAA